MMNMLSRRSITAKAVVTAIGLFSGCVRVGGEKEDDVSVCNLSEDDIKGDISIRRKENASVVLDDDFTLEKQTTENLRCEQFGEPISYGGEHVVEITLNSGRSDSTVWNVPQNPDGSHDENELMEVLVHDKKIEFRIIQSGQD
jgi:hypothetical protein